MKLFIVAIRDIKTNLFGQPIPVRALGEAIRSFEDQCGGRGNDNMLKNHPEDFELYQLATYDETTGEFVNEKVQIAVGGNYKRAN